MVLPYRLLNLYPPFIGAGIRVHFDKRDPYAFRVRMPLTWFNRNVFGTHFGGSLYAIADPFLALILLKTLGKGYMVWDKSACVTFVRPGRSAVHADFRLRREEVEAIRARADRGEVVEPVYEVDVVDEAGQVVAHVQKVLYVRKKKSSGRREPARVGE